jgi:hypothetical protein
MLVTVPVAAGVVSYGGLELYESKGKVMGTKKMVITVDDVRAITSSLPRSYEVLVRDQIKFRVGQIVYVAFSRDETVMGVAFPKEERAAMVAAEPDKFTLPRKSDMRYNWIHVQLDAIDLKELRELVIDGWRMCVPKSVAAAID